MYASVTAPVSRRTVLCNVRNAGVGSVPRHVVDYSVMTPPDLRS